jgi:cell filamentation protein
MTEPENTDAWRSYLMPGTDSLRTLPGFWDPVAVLLFERITSAGAETTLRRTSDRPRTFDLDHLRDIHGRLFGDVYDWAGQLRYVDIGKPDQTGEPFLHHPWIATYADSVAEQLRQETNLSNLNDPGVWADRAAHYWHGMLHAHPFREGNGRACRIWIEDLAAEAGHTLDWGRSSPERNVIVATAAGQGDLEPMRALLTQVAGGTLGVDRPIDALDDLHKLQHSMACARTGQVFGTDEDKDRLAAQTTELAGRIEVVAHYLDTQPGRASTREQPAAVRWRGLAASIHPELSQTESWPQFAAELDEAAANGIDVADTLHTVARDLRNTQRTQPPTPAPTPRPPVHRSPQPAPAPRPPQPELAAAGYYRSAPPPATGPRR